MLARPGKRMRLTPRCPLTVKRYVLRQTGETCCTTKTTRAARRSTNVKVVVRRPLGPLVAIQRRDVRNRSTLDRPGAVRATDEPEDGEPFVSVPMVAPPTTPPAPEEAADPDEPEVPEDTVPVAEDTAAWPEGTDVDGTVGLDGRLVPGAGAAGLGAGTAGTGSLGIEGNGTDGGGGSSAEADVVVGRGGTGTVSAKDWPASRPAPTRTVVAAAAAVLMSE